MWNNARVQASKSTEERFWEKVSIPTYKDDCWVWLGACDQKGYGMFQVSSYQTVRAHRWAYEDTTATIPKGLTLDHLCRNHPCVNPLHLEPVTVRENILRGEGPTAVRARQTACYRGHVFNAANTYIDLQGYRQCRTCRKARDHRRRRKSV